MKWTGFYRNRETSKEVYVDGQANILLLLFLYIRNMPKKISNKRKSLSVAKEKGKFKPRVRKSNRELGLKFH